MTGELDEELDEELPDELPDELLVRCCFLGRTSLPSSSPSSAHRGRFFSSIFCGLIPGNEAPPTSWTADELANELAELADELADELDELADELLAFFFFSHSRPAFRT